MVRHTVRFGQAPALNLVISVRCTESYQFWQEKLKVFFPSSSSSWILPSLHAWQLLILPKFGSRSSNYFKHPCKYLHIKRGTLTPPHFPPFSFQYTLKSSYLTHFVWQVQVRSRCSSLNCLLGMVAFNLL